jgi:hypothetical protein
VTGDREVLMGIRSTCFQLRVRAFTRKRMPGLARRWGRAWRTDWLGSAQPPLRLRVLELFVGGALMNSEIDDINQRILAHMRRAPGGNYTAVQLSRTTGLSVPEVQQRLTDLQSASAILRAPQLPYPAYCLASQQPASAGRMTPREAADLGRSRPAA